MGGNPVVVRQVEDVPGAGLQFLAFRQGRLVGGNLFLAEFFTVPFGFDVLIDLQFGVPVDDPAVLQSDDFRII